MAAFYLLAGVVEIGCAVAEFLAAQGKIELRTWPFVQSDSRATKYVFASGFLVVGLVLLGLGLRS